MQAHKGRTNKGWRWWVLLGAGLGLCCLTADAAAAPAQGETTEAEQLLDMFGPAAEPPPQAAPAVAGEEAVKTRVEKADGGVELHAKNDDLLNVLELLGRLYELNVVAGKNVKGKVTADLYGVTVDQALDAICRANNLKWVRQDKFIYVHTPEELVAITQDEARLTTEVFVLNYLTAEEATKLVQPALSKKGTTAVTSASKAGIPSGPTEVGGNSFGLTDAVIVRDFPENLEQVRAIVKQMDRRPRQVLVEATILQVTLNDSCRLGIDFNALAGVDFRDLTTLATPVFPDPWSVPAGITTGAAQTANAVGSTWGQAYTSGFGERGAGLNVGVITNNVSFFISALESVTDTTVLSNPKVLALNKQMAEVLVGQEIGYISTQTSETTTTQTVQFLSVGTQLRFRPFISDDGYIRMEVHPEVSSGAINPLTNVPDKTTTHVTCNVMIKDGHTIVIGGLFDETDTISRSQVPGLGNIPGLGVLFRNKRDSSIRHEIVVLLTPHIIEDEEANAIGEQLRDDAERRCMGMRAGFSFYTRERLTVFHLQAAEKAWQTFQTSGAERDLKNACWNVNLALNVAPNNLKALRLKDKVLTAQKGRPARPAPWTVWDSLGERLKPTDRTRGLVPPQPAQAPPEEPQAAGPAAEGQAAILPSRLELEAEGPAAESEPADTSATCLPDKTSQTGETPGAAQTPPDKEDTDAQG